MSDFKPIETQEALDALVQTKIKERLAREKTNATELKKQLDEANAKLEETKTAEQKQAEALAKKEAEAEKRVKDLEDKFSTLETQRQDMAKEAIVSKSGAQDADYVKFLADKLVSEEVSFDKAVETIKADKQYAHLFKAPHIQTHTKTKTLPQEGSALQNKYAKYSDHLKIR